jgi:hypothetical protein
MDLYRVTVAAHLFLSIILVGLALFWWIMLVALRQRYDSQETQRLLGVANAARWPHVAVPYKLRIPLPFMSWITLVLLAITGLEIMHVAGTPTGILWQTKLVLLAIVLILQLLVTGRPRPALIPLNLLAVLALCVVSALMIRG